MKRKIKRTVKKSAPGRPQNASHHNHNLRLIPWAMCLLAVFYLVSLKMIFEAYPGLLSIPSSYAENLTAVPLSAVGSNIANPENTTFEKNTATTTATDYIKDAPLSSVEEVTMPTTDSAKETAVDESQAAANTDENNDIIETGYTNEEEEEEEDKNDEVADISPNLNFLKPSAGSTIKGKYSFAASVENAKEVEFFLVKTGSLTNQHICTAKKKEGNKWTCEVETRNIPNGKYKLAAKISNRFGNYKSASISLQIKNDVASSSAADSSSSEKSSQAKTTSVAELKNVTETIEKRSQQQNMATSGTRGSVKQNATVAGALPSNIDSDQDGISNGEEERIGTDSNSADSDKDGYLDGDEIKKGFNPLKSSRGDEDKIVFESPKEKGRVKKDLVKVESVEMVSEPENPAPETPSEVKKEIQLKGKGLPFSFVTIYVYSENPTIVTVMTDQNGDWNYSMDIGLENGVHEVYVAITDNEGHITAKGEPFAFVKTAQAATKATDADIAAHRALIAQSPVAASKGKRMAAIGILAFVSLFTAIASIGLYLIYRYHHTKNQTIQKDYIL